MEEIYCDEIIINSMMLTKVSSENVAKDLHKNNVAILWRDTKNQIGRGSGILISKNLVLTCAHNLYWLGQRVNNNLFSIYPGLDGKLERAYKIEACYIPEEYPKAPKIHIILDQSGYHRSNEVAEFVKNSRIVIHFLPPYSPNLNPIERLWKVMNQKVRNNKVFETAKKFKAAILGFFTEILPNLKEELRSRINDNFHILNPGSSI